MSGIFAAPLAAGLMSMDGLGGLAGWQYLFILEGVPSVLLGLAMLVWLPSTPLSAWMLTHDERELLHRKVRDALGHLWVAMGFWVASLGCNPSYTFWVWPESHIFLLEGVPGVMLVMVWLPSTHPWPGCWHTTSGRCCAPLVKASWAA